MGIPTTIKAVFLDRDGVCNSLCGTDNFGNPESPLRLQDFQIFSFVGDAIREINQLGFLAFVVTNQPAIAKGKMSPMELGRMHNALEQSVLRKGGKIAKIYHCLHHPDPKQVVKKHLLANCVCRKPKPGMLLQASLEFGIDLKKSWMIGDTWRDVLAGEKAQCRTILISPNEKVLSQCKPNFTAENLSEAVKILRKETVSA